MPRHIRPDRPASITSVPESPADELARRQRRYAVMAVIFVASFTTAAVVHQHTALALLLCAVAIAALVLGVIGANVRLPRRPAGPRRVVGGRPQLPPAPEDPAGE